MSVYFEITNLYLENCAEIEHRANYGGRMDAVHLASNSAYRLPFAIRIPTGFGFYDIITTPCVAHFRRHTGHMDAEDGVDFEHYQLVIRPVESIRNPRLRRRAVVIERVYDDLLPLDECPAGYKKPDEPGLPTEDDPIIVSSHTEDGGGWYTYLVYTIEES